MEIRKKERKKKRIANTLFNNHSPPRNFHRETLLKYLDFVFEIVTITISQLYFSNTRREIRNTRSRRRRRWWKTARKTGSARGFPAFNLLPREEPQIHFIDSRPRGRERERIREAGNPGEESVPWDISYPYPSNVTPYSTLVIRPSVYRIASNSFN